jgi:hypothetical protein
MEQVYVITSHGKIHMGAKDHRGRILTAEECNLDDAERRPATPDEVANAEASAFCLHDFPEKAHGPV